MTKEVKIGLILGCGWGVTLFIALIVSRLLSANLAGSFGITIGCAIIWGLITVLIIKGIEKRQS
jgi:hypothetical protein